MRDNEAGEYLHRVCWVSNRGHVTVCYEAVTVSFMELIILQASIVLRVVVLLFLIKSTTFLRWITCNFWFLADRFNSFPNKYYKAFCSATIRKKRMWDSRTVVDIINEEYIVSFFSYISDCCWALLCLPREKTAFAQKKVEIELLHRSF